MSAETVCAFLETHGIAFQRVDHPPVFTCEEADQFVPDMPGAKTKNLFLRDGKGRRHFLVTVAPEKTVNLKALSKTLGASGLGFASAERLQQYLGLTPGSVSLLGVINDHSNAVTVIIDSSLWQADAFLCHPLINTSTLALAKKDLVTFLEQSSHTPTIVEVPSA